MGHVFKFVRLLRHLVNLRRNGTSKILTYQDNSRSSGILADDDIINAEKCFWRKGTEEVKLFTRAEKYSRISTNNDGILTYTGRTLPSNKIEIINETYQVEVYFEFYKD